MPLLEHGDTSIPYEIRRSRRARRLRIVVTPGRVEVVAPPGAGDGQIRAFVERKRRWLAEKTEALRERALAPLPPRFVAGARVLFRGRFLEVRVEPAEIDRPTLRFASAFNVRLPAELADPEREAAARELVTRWLAERAADDARRFVRLYAPRLGVLPSAVRIGYQKTIWGSCSARGVISLNWRLMAAPRAIYEYVVVHELCHLIERGHDRAFWRLVERLLPDYRDRRGWLREHGVALG